MNKERIAVLIDSCTDVPASLVKEYGMYVVPLKVIYKNREFYDGIDISPDDVYANLHVEIPKTSLPSGEVIQDIFDRIKSDGYEKVIAITISSGLSGTNNLINLIARQNEDLTVHVFDTKNIAIGAGFSAVRAAQMIRDGLSYESIVSQLDLIRNKTKLYFCVATLEYLQKGGRIGLVAGMLGSALNLKPIITCNEDGIYYTVAKVRGRKQSLSKALDLAVEFAKGHKRYHIAVSNGLAAEEAEEIKQKLKELLPDYELVIEGQISPALGVHTGPGAIGIAVTLLD